MKPMPAPVAKSFKLVLLYAHLFLPIAVFSQQTVPEKVMQAVYEQIKTPYKYGLVIDPSDTSKRMDSPSVFRKDGKWYMIYIVFDGKGYETWQAESIDLLHWQTQGKLLSYSDSADWDGNQKAGYIALQDETFGGSYQLQPYAGNYWMSYLGGSSTGYEAGNLSIGIAYTNSNLTIAHPWQRLQKPVLSSKDADTHWWEDLKLFKSSIVWDKKKTTRYPFVMYYNALTDSSQHIARNGWYERIGMAVSNDMKNWKRLQQDPVLQHSKGITGDPYLQKIGNVWVMFYFGAFWENKGGAFNRFACSYDLVHWTDWQGDDLVKSSMPFDDQFAHKSYVVKYKGVVYHFYCAVDKANHRGIAVATSKDLGTSKLAFPSR